MRVLLITDTHTTHGGAEKYFFELKQRLKEHQIEVFSLGFGENEAAGNDYIVFKALKSNIAKLCGRFIIHPLLLKKLRRQINQFKPDIVHLHNMKQYAPTILKAIAGIPTIQTVHDFSLLCPTAQNIHRDGTVCKTGITSSCLWQHNIQKNSLSFLAKLASFWLLRKQLRKRVHTFLSPSPFLAEYLTKNQFSNVKYIPPFISDTLTLQETDPLPHHFLFVGSLAEHKGIFPLIEEFHLAHKKNPKLSLTMVGNGPAQEALLKKITELQLENHIHLPGWQENLIPFYQSAIALIFPSTGLESFGLVLTEAMANAKPVIGVNRGTTAWLVDHEQTGRLYNPLVKGELANQMLLLADNPSLAKQFGINGKNKLHRLFDNETTLRNIIDVYHKTAITL